MEVRLGVPGLISLLINPPLAGFLSAKPDSDPECLPRHSQFSFETFLLELNLALALQRSVFRRPF